MRDFRKKKVAPNSKDSVIVSSPDDPCTSNNNNEAVNMGNSPLNNALFSHFKKWWPGFLEGVNLDNTIS